MIKAYEVRITKLEKEKRILHEQLENVGQNRRPFGEMFELAMTFFANPQKLWREGTLEHKRTVLKLAFKDRLAYKKNEGFRTPNFSMIFSGLQDFFIKRQSDKQSI